MALGAAVRKILRCGGGLRGRNISLMLAEHGRPEGGPRQTGRMLHLLGPRQCFVHPLLRLVRIA
jgi:hypothetical protein